MAASDETPDLLEWFRLDRAGGTRWLLIGGGLFGLVGGALLCGAFLAPTRESWQAFGTYGSGLLVFGLFIAFGGMALLLANDDYLAVRADGVLLHRAAGDVIVGWDSLSRVRAESRAIVLDGDTPMRIEERYTGATRVELAAHLETLRRKAQMAELTFDVVKSIALGLPHVRPGSVKRSES
jgi:hypothetical protein